jgi:hypothetical protein
VRASTMARRAKPAWDKPRSARAARNSSGVMGWRLACQPKTLSLMPNLERLAQTRA